MHKIIYLLVILLVSTGPILAEDFDATACNHDTGDCYDAEVNLDYGTVIINYSENNSIKLELEDTDIEDLSAYDEKQKVFFDIELIK